MRFKVELAESVYLDLMHGLSPPEVEEFAEKMRRLEVDPFGWTEHHADDPDDKRDFRRFRFGKGVLKIAIFHVDLRRHRIEIVRCRPMQSRTFTDDAGAAHGGG